MSIWCPKCHYKTVLAKFFGDRCPQCGTIVEAENVLHRDPYKIQEKHRKHDDRPKKFSFDQKAGTDGKETGSGALKSHPVDPTFGITSKI